MTTGSYSGMVLQFCRRLMKRPVHRITLNTFANVGLFCAACRFVDFLIGIRTFLFVYRCNYLLAAYVA